MSRARVWVSPLVVGLLASVGLGACADMAPPPRAKAPATATSTAPAASTVPAISSAPGTPGVPARPGVEVREFVGLSGAEITSALGRAPAFLRRDGRAEIWRYGGRSCFLDLFLYPKDGAHRVAHAELRRREGHAGLSESACLADVLDGN